MATAPPLLQISDVHLSFGGNPLLEGADLSVGIGARICLVGRNGSGKSTLLKSAAGLVEPDKGQVFVQPGVVVRYLAQNPVFKSGRRVEDIVLEDIFGNEDRQKAHQLMAELHLKPDASIDNLSGGEMRRVALAQAMSCQPDILLLDEPTNHLDLPAIEWLETVLRQQSAALILVSHDRRFLTNMADDTIWLDRGQTHVTGTRFDKFEDWRDDYIEREAVAMQKLGRKIAREEDWIRHGVSGRRKRNVRRVGELLSLRNQRDQHIGPTGGVTMQVQDADSSGKLVAKFDKVNKSFGDKTVARDVSFTFSRGNRIGIIGANGSGKTTLLKLMLGEVEPDSGIIRLGKKLEPLILDQKRSGIKKDWTIKDALTDGAGDLVSLGEETIHVIGYMKAFLFHPSQMRTPAAILSGGEQARLLLARGLRHPSNFLIMDEPTNDLDLETLDLLQEMLANYPGTIIIVSHDRDFLDRTVTHILNAEGEGDWVAYAGGYSDMLAQRAGKALDGQANKKHPAAKNNSVSSGASKVKVEKSDAEGVARQSPKRSARLSYKQSYRLEKLPAEMDALQVTIDKLEAQMADSNFYARDPEAFQACAKELDLAKLNFENLEIEWLELEILREALDG